MKEFNIQHDFSISVAQFFDLFFLNPKFKLDFHVKRGDTEISVGDWKELGSNKHERAIKFCSQVSDQAFLKKLTGGMSPVVHEKQDYEFIDKELHVCSLATTSAGGFNCATTADYTISEVPISSSMNGKSPAGNAACHVDIVVKSEFKSRLFKGQVENMMNQQATQTFDQWLALVKEKIADFHKEESTKQKPIQLPVQTHTHLSDYMMDTLSSTQSTATESECDTDDESYYDAQDLPFSSPPSRTSTPPPHDNRNHTPPPPLHERPHSSNNPPRSISPLPPSGGLAGVVHNLQKELQHLRSITEVNASRLLGLETSKYQTTSSPSIHNNSNNNRTTGSASTSLSANEGLVPYLQRLELLAQQQEEEVTRGREREQEWKRKFEELQSRLEGPNNKKGMVPGWLGVVFILVWPVVAQKLWKYAEILQPIVARVFWKMLGK